MENTVFEDSNARHQRMYKYVSWYLAWSSQPIEYNAKPQLGFNVWSCHFQRSPHLTRPMARLHITKESCMMHLTAPPNSIPQIIDRAAYDVNLLQFRHIRSFSDSPHLRWRIEHWGAGELEDPLSLIFQFVAIIRRVTRPDPSFICKGKITYPRYATTALRHYPRYPTTYLSGCCPKPVTRLGCATQPKVTERRSCGGEGYVRELCLYPSLAPLLLQRGSSMKIPRSGDPVPSALISMFPIRLLDLPCHQEYPDNISA